MPVNGIQGFPRLRILAFGNSSLTGAIPLWLRQCVELRSLDLSWNHLSGEIPCWFGSFVHLFALSLSHNFLGGKIPISLTQLRRLSLGVTSQDNASPSYPPLYSWITGSPVSDFRIYKLCSQFPRVLNLSHNNLNGSIPKQFGNLTYVTHLDLSWNNLSGFIPEEMANMVNQEMLDLSFNMLTGSIPPSLTKLTFLSEFNVAYNRLQGLIPDGGQFNTFPGSSYEGNLGLYSNNVHLCNSTLDTADEREEAENYAPDEKFFIGVPFAGGLLVGFLPTVLSSFVLLELEL